jgi:hypothetical protein
LANAAEVMMYRELSSRFRRDDKWTPQWQRPEDRPPELRPNYTKEERERAGKEFEPMIKLLVRFGKLNHAEAAVLRVCHKIRVEAFHRASWNENILLPTTVLLFLTVSELTTKFRPGWYTLPDRDDGPDVDFLKRFGLKSAHALHTEESARSMRDILIADVTLDLRAYCTLLAEELEDRIENTISSIADLQNSEGDAAVDHSLQYTQFWREQGAEIARACSERQEAWEPTLQQAFDQWKIQPGAKYTVPKLRLLQRHAAALRTAKTASNVLERYWNIQCRFIELEEDVIQAVIDFDMEHG